MKKLLTTLAAGSALALVSVAAPTAAEARCIGCGVAAGVVGGIALGAAIAGSGPYYGGAYDYAPGYAYGPGYAYAPGYAYGPAPYGYYRYRGASCDRRNFSYDRQLQGSC
jgi:hypothetical protein